MSTSSTSPAAPGAQTGLRASWRRVARPLCIGGGVLLIVAAMLPWTYNATILGDLTLSFYPYGSQIWALVLGIVAVAAGVLSASTPTPRARAAAGAARGAAIGAVAVTVVATICIAVKLDGLANLDPGLWIGLAGAILLLAGAWGLVDPEVPDPRLHLPAAVEIVILAAVLALGLFAIAYLLAQTDPWQFFSFAFFVASIALVLHRIGVIGELSLIFIRRRTVAMLGSFAVAFTFPLTQHGDANMSIMVQVVIFAVTAMGLNIVVGLAGLLDLGYIAFLGSGAYVAAILSTSIYSSVDWHPPFLVVVLIGGAVTAALGLIIGTPTLRVSGDYLAIVTLAFGEIFRLTVNNLDGTNGPDLSHGPNGIAAVPDLTIGGFDFGDKHDVLGITLGRPANYYLLMLVLLAFVVLIFVRLNSSRIGRGWVAIREDERAAEAMGVNAFGLKLLAFAGGAFLAGIAGTVKAHYDTSVSPDQYPFLESSFLLAAVVLGGMGTVGGVLLGALLLKMLPEKFRFFSEYRLLTFGLVLILVMRFRPEGLVPSKRRQLEFHSDDEQLADAVEQQTVSGVGVTSTTAGSEATR
jgi:branched-chain amino acid transport system permease protein